MIPADALPIAEEIRAALAPYCEPGRCVIAGSIRRRCPEVGDVEIVCIPRSRDLFGFAVAVDRWIAIKGKPTGRYTQRQHPSGLCVDIFMATPDNWGAILLIRTGDREFSKHFMGWLLPSKGYQQREGYVWKSGVKVPVREENDLFVLVGLDFIEPQKRIGRLG